MAGECDSARDGKLGCALLVRLAERQTMGRECMLQVNVCGEGSRVSTDLLWERE